MLQFYIPEVLGVEQVIPEHEKVSEAEFSKFEKKRQGSNNSGEENDPILSSIKTRDQPKD